MTAPLDSDRRGRGATTTISMSFDDQFDIDPVVVEAFRHDGHACVRGLASRSEVEGLLPAIEAAAAQRTAGTPPMEERDTYGKAFLQAINVYKLDDALRAYVFGRRFARAVARLLGVDGVRLYHDQALIKEAGEATPPGTRTSATGRSTPTPPSPCGCRSWTCPRRSAR